MNRFFLELKRRNVYRAGAAYAVVSWLLIQIATQVFPFFEVPGWGVRLIVIVLVAGFPFALLFAWAFEITPEGIKRTEEVPPQSSSTGATARRLNFIIMAVLLLAVGLLLFDRFRPYRLARDLPEKSIAVLPFASLSEDKANAYFADGIQDEILTRLSKIGAIKVISRTSTQQFQSRPNSVTEIAKQLGVAHVLEGSVQKSNDSVRVNVQLIRADHDSHLWGETYDRKLTDIFGVESEIAEKIAKSLEAQLSGGERKAIAVVPTQNPQAYESYLRALSLLNKQGYGELTAARDALAHAVELDPNFAPAWARLALANSELYFGGGPGEQDQTPAQLERARHAAETAMRLQPDSSDAHLGLGSFYYYCLKDFDRALSELNEARKLAPNDAYIIFATGLVKRRQGKLDEALKLQLEAAVLDPRNSDMWANLARTYRGRRDFAHAREMYDRAIAIAPDESDLVAEKADTFLSEGKLEEAEALVAHAGSSPLSSAFGTRVSLAILRRDFARAIELLTRSVNSSEVPKRIRASDRVDLGSFQLALNDPAGRANIEQGRAELEAIRNEGDTAPENIAMSIFGAAFLGDRDAVARDGEEFLRQSEHDRWQLPRVQIAVARAYAVLAEADRAVALLAAALASPGDITPTPASLRLDPVWDRIRSDPRFRKLAGAE